MTTLLAFAFVLGVLVFVHELGHFLAAKRVGIRVLKFQLGFNPTILSFRRGDTEYSIGALPLGGYVKMAGESLEDGRAGRPDEFLSKTKWQRFQVLVMGPVMNLLLAVVLLAILLYRGVQVPVFEDQPPQVGVVSRGSPAEQIDIRPGDLILSVGGREVATWEQFLIAVGTRPNREVEIELLRDGARVVKRVTPTVSPNEKNFEIGDIGVLPDTHPRLTSISPGEPAERAGLKAGDIVLAANGEPMTFSAQLRDIIAKNVEKPVTFTIRRDGVEQNIDVTPAKTGEIGRVGVIITDETKSIQPGVFEAIRLSVRQNYEMASLIFTTLADLVMRETSPSQLIGPMGIAQLSGESAQLGMIALLGLMAQLSLNLGLINLLPIPVLDGGHIFIMALEGLARRDFSIKFKEKMLLAGLVVLMMLMGTAIYNDLTRISWIERLMPWR